jgi:hypothetical protein
MELFKNIALLIILSELVFAGCASNSSNPVGEDGKDTYTIIGPDYRNQGKGSYDSLEGQLKSSTGCEVSYTYYRPRDVSSDVLVIIGHGFMRSKRRMAYWAQHLAGWGLSVVNLEFPVDGKCSFVCGKGEIRFSRDMIQQTILGLTTAFLLWQTGIDTNGETWWHDSKQNYKTLIDAGYIKKPINDETDVTNVLPPTRTFMLPTLTHRN